MDIYFLNILTEIWQNHIKQAYIIGSIPSERHLQSELFHALKLSLSEYQIYVEPYEFRIETPKSIEESHNENIIRGYVPDLIITKSTRVVAIIEIKYTPHAHCDYKDDMYKLLHYKNYSTLFSLTVDYVMGDFDKSHLVEITNDTALIFMGVAKSDSGAFEIKNWKIINNLLVFAGKVDVFRNSHPEFLRCN